MKKLTIFILFLLLATGSYVLAQRGDTDRIQSMEPSENQSWDQSKARHLNDCQNGEIIGFVKVESENDFETTLNNAKTMIEQNPAISLMAEVDHRQNALNANLEPLPPTTLLIFGNPNLGTPLMQRERTMAIDLPQKMLIWEDEDGATWIAYNEPLYLKWRHDIENQRDIFIQIAEALNNLATGAAAGQ